jgi:hypothetical protein
VFFQKNLASAWKGERNTSHVSHLSLQLYFGKSAQKVLFFLHPHFFNLTCSHFFSLFEKRVQLSQAKQLMELILHHLDETSDESFQMTYAKGTKKKNPLFSYLSLFFIVMNRYLLMKKLILDDDVIGSSIFRLIDMDAKAKFLKFFDAILENSEEASEEEAMENFKKLYSKNYLAEFVGTFVSISKDILSIVKAWEVSPSIENPVLSFESQVLVLVLLVKILGKFTSYTGSEASRKFLAESAMIEIVFGNCSLRCCLLTFAHSFSSSADFLKEFEKEHNAWKFLWSFKIDLVRIVANIAFRNKIAQEKVLPHFFWFSFV